MSQSTEKKRWGVHGVMMCLGASMMMSGCMEHAQESERTLRSLTMPVTYESKAFHHALLQGKASALILSVDVEALSQHGLNLGEVAARLESGAIGEIEAVHGHGALGMVSVQITPGSTLDLAALEALPGVRGVHEELMVYPHSTSAQAFINQPLAEQDGHLGAGVTVAVLDTGVDWTHEDFGSCTAPGVAGCRVVHAQDFGTDDGELDDHGHGTNVAGIVARVAPAADIVALDVFEGGVANSTTILSALNWVVANRTTHGIGVVNMSFGSGYYATACTNTVFGSVMQTLRQNGIVPVASSGNDGFVGGMGVPACDPGVVSVGAVYDHALRGGVLYSSCADGTTAADQVACFSNTASFLDVLAPGVGMNAGGYTMSGTSQAAPVVAAAFAILQSAYPTESITEQIARVKRSRSIMDARSGDQVARLDFADILDVAVLCTYTYTPVLSYTHDEGDGIVEIDVATPAHCAWSAQVTRSWAMVDTAVHRGNGRIEVWLESNPDVIPRQVDVELYGETVKITQEGRDIPKVKAELIDVKRWLVWNWKQALIRAPRIRLFVSASSAQE